MRGLAALVVIFSHSIKTFYPDAFSKGFSLYYPIVAAHESVMFFFLLSGFVLSLPYLGEKGKPYSVYLLRRIVRVYGPYLTALAISIAACAMWYTRPGTPAWPSGMWPDRIRITPVVQHVLFLGNYNYRMYNMAFWSLVYEMRISIIFPLLFVLSMRLKTAWTLMVVVGCTFLGVADPSSSLVSMVGDKSLITVEYVGIFLTGILLATNLDEISAWYVGLPSWCRKSFAVASLVLYYESCQVRNIGPLWHLGDMLIVIGAAGLLIVAISSERARSTLNTPVPKFLGRISYSLYLIHAVVLYIMVTNFRNSISHPLLILLFIPLAVAASWGFYTAVEAPFMRLSRRVV
jgi:peptidoglycan/LPS O-acetylase OafA/YrhL